MILIVLYLQNKFDQADSKLLQEIRKLNNNFSKIESELSMTKQVNSLLSHRLLNMEHQCQANAQYSKRECLDIIGILSEVEADVLEGKAAKILQRLGCNIPSNCTDACHRVSARVQQSLLSFHKGTATNKFWH